MDNIVPIVFAINDLYALQMCVAIQSLIDNKYLNTRYNVYILYNDLSKSSRQRIKYMNRADCHIFLIDVMDICTEIEAYFSNCKMSTITSDTILFRYLIAEVLPKSHKALYLDCDILIKQDLGELLRLNIAEVYAAVVPDVNQSIRLKEINNKNKRYFNSGVILFNLDKFREDNIKKRLLEQSNNLRLVDQEALNLVFGDCVYYLPIKYNLIVECVLNMNKKNISIVYEGYNYNTRKEAIDDAVILHFAGNRTKPWIYNIPYISEMYCQYLKKSSYGDFNLHLIEYHGVQWIMPQFNEICRKKIVLYGIGAVGRDYLKQIITLKRCERCFLADRNAKDFKVLGMPIFEPSDLCNLEFDYVVVAVVKEEIANEIISDLCDLGITKNKILWKPPIVLQSYMNCLNELKRNI